MGLFDFFKKSKEKAKETQTKQEKNHLRKN